MDCTNNINFSLPTVFSRDQLNVKHTVRLFSVAFFCVVVHVFWSNAFPLWSYVFSSAEFGAVTNRLIDTLVLSILAATLLAIVLLYSVTAGKIIVYALLTIGAAYSYYHHHFGIVISDEIMVSMLFFAEKNDVLSSMDGYLPLYLVVMTIPAFLVCRLALNSLPQTPDKSAQSFSLAVVAHLSASKFVSTTILLFIIPILLGAIHLTSDLSLMSYRVRTVSEQIMPSFLLSRKSNIHKLARMYKEELKLADYTDLDLSFAPSSSSPLTVVLVVGESLRSDRLSINGYHRSTTPLMEKRRNLYSFKNVQACSTTTAGSLPCMLTDNRVNGWKTFTAHRLLPCQTS